MPLNDQNEGGSSPTIATGQCGYVFVDPSEDPDLAIALQIAIVENRSREAAEDTAGKQQEAVSTHPTASQPKDEDILARAYLYICIRKKKESGLTNVTEDEQIEYAMKMTMQTSGDPVETVKDENMEVDKFFYEATTIKKETELKSGAYSEAVDDQQFLHSVLESITGDDAKSEGVWQAMEALTGTLTRTNL